jgi:hypothetical protein
MSFDKIFNFFIVIYDPVCQNGWKRFNNLCYWISKTTLNFNKAQQNCTARGAKLAEIYTKSEYEFLRKRLYDGVDSIDAWFGLQKVANVTKYTYSQSSEPNYTAIGVHFIPDISKHCVTIVLPKHDATWEAKQCDLKLNSYVCQTEINRGKNPPPPQIIFKFKKLVKMENIWLKQLFTCWFFKLVYIVNELQ